MKHPPFPTHILTGLALAFLWQAPTWAGITESFESAEPSLQVIDRDCWYRLEAQSRTSTHVHSGNASEYVRIAAGPGTRILIGQRVPAARVIDELVPEMWIRSDRAGLQMMARVVLPRVVDPVTGQGIERSDPSAWTADPPRGLSETSPLESRRWGIVPLNILIMVSHWLRAGLSSRPRRSSFNRWH